MCAQFTRYYFALYAHCFILQTIYDPSHIERECILYLNIYATIHPFSRPAQSNSKPRELACFYDGHSGAHLYIDTCTKCTILDSPSFCAACHTICARKTTTLTTLSSPSFLSSLLPTTPVNPDCSRFCSHVYGLNCMCFFAWISCCKLSTYSSL